MYAVTCETERSTSPGCFTPRCLDLSSKVGRTVHNIHNTNAVNTQQSIAMSNTSQTFSTMFDQIPTTLCTSDESDGEDDLPLSTRREKFKLQPDAPTTSIGPVTDYTVPQYNVDALNAQERRTLVRRIFFEEQNRLLYAPDTIVSRQQKDHLRPYLLRFDRGTRRRGVCHYPTKTRRPFLGLSAAMVDGGASASSIAKIIRHELSHACNPGCKHGPVWRAFDIAIGGDGKRCCSDSEVSNVIGHRVEIACRNGCFISKRQNAPSRKWQMQLHHKTIRCMKCKASDSVFWKRI